MRKLKPNKNLIGIFYLKIKILQFPNNNELVSDEDIISLMHGLINLVKRSTEVSVEEKYIRQINSLNNELLRLKRKFKI